MGWDVEDGRLEVRGGRWDVEGGMLEVRRGRWDVKDEDGMMEVRGEI